jgi:hypothetical protein
MVIRMESVEFSQQYYLQKAPEAGYPFLNSSRKSLNPRCREFTPKSFVYSGIHSTPSRPSRPKKDNARRERKVKKEIAGVKHAPREWEWMEPELEEVKDVWGEATGEIIGGDGDSGIGKGDPGHRGGKAGGGVAGGAIGASVVGVVGGVGGNGGTKRKGDEIDVAGKIIAPRGKSWMIVTQKMVEYSF